MQNRMVFFVVAVAVIMAIAGFLLLSFLTRGAEPAEDVVVEPAPGEGAAADGAPPAAAVDQQIQIDGTIVTLHTVPDKAVSLSQQPVVEQPTLQPTPAPTETPGVAPEPVQPTAPPATGGGESVVFIDYVVQPSDTLYSIADRQATSIELMAVHGISAEDIVPGTTLRLPVANPAVCAGMATYVVRPGDTVFSISRRYNTTTQAIASANGLGPDFRIDVAEVLCIP